MTCVFTLFRAYKCVFIFFTQHSTEIDVENETQGTSRKLSRPDTDEFSLKEKFSQTVTDWSPYGMAALAVGLGMAYTYLKST